MSYDIQIEMEENFLNMSLNFETIFHLNYKLRILGIEIFDSFYHHPVKYVNKQVFRVINAVNPIVIKDTMTSVKVFLQHISTD